MTVPLPLLVFPEQLDNLEVEGGLDVLQRLKVVGPLGARLEVQRHIHNGAVRGEVCGYYGKSGKKGGVSKRLWSGVETLWGLSPNTIIRWTQRGVTQKVHALPCVPKLFTSRASYAQSRPTRSPGLMQRQEKKGQNGKFMRFNVPVSHYPSATPSLRIHTAMACAVLVLAGAPDLGVAQGRGHADHTVDTQRQVAEGPELLGQRRENRRDVRL